MDICILNKHWVPFIQQLFADSLLVDQDFWDLMVRDGSPYLQLVETIHCMDPVWWFQRSSGVIPNLVGFVVHFLHYILRIPDDWKVVMGFRIWESAHYKEVSDML